MKAECVREKLKEAVQIAERVTGKNLSLPILSSILLEAGDGVITLRSTNLDVGLEISVPAKVDMKGVVAVSGGIFGTFLGAIGEERTVKIELVGENLALEAGRHATVLKSLPVADFPTLPRVDDGEKIHITPDGLVEGIRSVVYASALSDMKPELSSVYVWADGGDLVFVATDSFRLAEKRISLSTKIEKMSPMLIPYKNALEVVRIFSGRTEPVEVYFNKNQISFSSPNIYFTSRLVFGVFPNYRQIMPSKHSARASVLKKEILNALKLSQIFTDKFNQIRCHLVPQESFLEIGSKSAEVGENSTRLDGVFEGEEIDINFNVKYLLDCFQTVQEDTIQLDFSGPGRPLLLRGAGNQTFSYIVMPLNK